MTHASQRHCKGQEDMRVPFERAYDFMWATLE